jgi:predicted RNase H-like HicB family nuclease
MGPILDYLYFGSLYMKKEKQYTVLIEKGEDGNLIGTALEIKGCHSQGKNMEELLANIREAIELCLEVQGESESYIKEIVGIQKVAV